ncbi:hypothetical protein ACTPOJ_04475 [Bifidobacterium longum]|mgnify:CR=1 FL=1|uniref:hypothetical protein n=1 Tax=Bifidobacterium longum TaxID=216816 RepID=UPI003FCE1F95
MTADLDEPYLDQNTDALGGKAGDDTAVGRLPDRESARVESEARERSELTDGLEDMSRNDSPGSNKSDASALTSITGWHPFLRFLFRVADMEYAFENNRAIRVHRFIREHKWIFRICFWADWAIVAIGSMGVVAVVIFAALKTLGLV